MLPLLMGLPEMLLPLQLLLYSAFATRAKPIYQLRLTLGLAGVALLLGRHLPSGFFFSSLSHFSLLLSCFSSCALVPKAHNVIIAPVGLPTYRMNIASLTVSPSATYSASVVERVTHF